MEALVSRRQVFVGLGVWLLGFLLILGVGVFLFRDCSGRPVCHKVTYGALRGWILSNGTNHFPNVHGRSRDSLALLRDEMESGILEEKYHYVPGLREQEPGDLVLMYLNQPTRYVWHGSPRTYLAPKGWIIVPLDFSTLTGRKTSGPGELSEWVSTSEFKQRLQHTLDFVRTNEWPHWQTVVKEHSEFLKSVKD